MKQKAKHPENPPARRSSPAGFLARRNFTELDKRETHGEKWGAQTRARIQVGHPPDVGGVIDLSEMEGP